MAKRSRMSMLKRQRELKKSEKAAQKRARKHGLPMDGPEPMRPNVSLIAPPEVDEPAEPSDDVSAATEDETV